MTISMINVNNIYDIPSINGLTVGIYIIIYMECLANHCSSWIIWDMNIWHSWMFQNPIPRWK